MYKILYASNEDNHASIQLKRSIPFLLESNSVKIAAYRNDVMPIDWNISCLKYYGNKYIFNNNRYLDIYEEQLLAYKPDLVISDCEFYTSYLALKNNLKLWHVSEKLLNFSVLDIYKKYINLHKYYSSTYEDHNFMSKINEMILSADNNFCYSHLGDMQEDPSIDYSIFKWMRPYYKMGYKHLACHHKHLSLTNKINYKIINYLSDKKDSVLFTNDNILDFENIKIKNFNEESEYACNLGNCDLYVSDGTSSSMADAFYNDKDTIIVPDHANKSSLLMYLLHKKIYGFLVENDTISTPEKNIKNNIKFLHQEVENEKLMP